MCCANSNLNKCTFCDVLWRIIVKEIIVSQYPFVTVYDAEYDVFSTVQFLRRNHAIMLTRVFFYSIGNSNKILQ